MLGWVGAGTGSALGWGQGWHRDGDWGCTSTTVGMRLGLGWD